MVEFFSEFGQFLIERKKWWLVPMAIILLLIGILTIVLPMIAPNAAIPFIYTLV
jgi:uncharacterized membrane protein HdeD (DUF308 family)